MHLWPAAAQLGHVPCQLPWREAALTLGSAWSSLGLSQMCLHCPLGLWQPLAQGSVEGVCSEPGVSSQQPSRAPQDAQGSISTSLVLGTGVRANMSWARVKLCPGLPEELVHAAGCARCPVEQEVFLCTGCSCSVSADSCRLLVKFPELNYQLKIKVCIDK